jgi:hypothetical protein
MVLDSSAVFESLLGDGVRGDGGAPDVLAARAHVGIDTIDLTTAVGPDEIRPLHPGARAG